MKITQLTKSELRVAHLVAKGHEDKIIASKLFNSPYTIHTHIRNIKKKLRLNNRVQIAVKYIQSLENPKGFMLSIAFAMGVISMSLSTSDFDMRRTSRGRRSRKESTI